MLLVGEVTGVRVGCVLKVGEGSLEGSELQGGSELVVGTLEDEDGAGDAGEKVAEGEDLAAEGCGPGGPEVKTSSGCWW